jgi:hypothetical protein
MPAGDLDTLVRPVAGEIVHLPALATAANQ